MPLLEIESLSLEIGGEPILRDVSLSLEAGEVLGLVGESGSGKSMTALSVLRLLPPEARASGKILLEGRDLLAMPEREMNRLRGARIGMIFQEPMTALNPLYTVGNQIGEVLELHEGLRPNAARGRAL
ncbi:MAG TPA: ATP-binding cassette domain-containing protein, partial [Caulobacteraceae bacterium]